MDDLISRQAAISAICNACGKIDCDKMDKCEKLQLPPANSSEFPNNSDTISRQAAIDTMDKVLIVFRDLGLSCAYDMPSFWYHDKKDYKVIPTKYHKGYMQALKDAEYKIKAILEELCYG